MNLGNAISDFRKSRQVRQKELAEKCKLTQSYLSQIESNLKQPSMKVLELIAKNLSVPLPVLIFLSLDEKDVTPKKRESFRMINKPIQSLITEFFT